MATKKPSTSKKPSAKKAATKTSASELKGQAGKTTRGKEFDPSQPEILALAGGAIVERMEPRPYVISRYPIPEDEFKKLKEAAQKKKVAKGDATLARDKGKKTEVATEVPADVTAGLVPGAAAPTPQSFAGIGATGWIPPDCTMAVGPDHVALAVNSTIAIFTKTGTNTLVRTLTVWFNNVIQNATIFDPKLLYDQHAGRWVLLAVAVSQNPNRSSYLLSVSSSSNPLGSWRNYNLNAMVDGATPTNNWADYPALGVDARNLYITSNQFQFGGQFQYAKIRVVPKAGPYSGGAAAFTDFVNMRNADNTIAFTIQPCHTFGAPQVEYLVNSRFPNGNFLTIWRLTETAAGFALNRTSVPTANYSLPPNAAQKGNNAPLNTGDIRVLHAVFRGDSIWCALNTAHNWTAATNTASIHWFQIRAAAPALVQQGIFGGANVHSFYPAPCPDSNGNMIMVFSRCGPGEFGSMYYTGRKATDPLGSLKPSVLVKAGVANYVRTDQSGRNRWGDYNGVAADPAEPLKIWIFSEYAAALNEWSTFVWSALA